MTQEEWQVAERRSQGLPWADIASELGGTAEGLRKQLARAVDRVSGELGLDEDQP
jgi:RNA polymerase sigma-70 factor (ECF subfamily)